MADSINKKGGDKINYATKADVILQRQAEISAKLDALLSGGAGAAGSEALVDKVMKENAYVSRQNSAIYEKLMQENEQLRKELNYVAAQCENVYVRLAEMIDGLKESFAIDYDKLADALKARRASGEIYAGFADEVAPAAAESALSDGEQLTIDRYIDYEELAERVSGKLAGKVTAVNAEPDYDEIARRVADCIPPQEVVSPDYIASKVAEQIVIPQVVIGENGQAQPVEVRATAQVDYDELARRIAEKLAPQSPDGDVALAAAEDTLSVELNTDDLSDEIARKVAALSPNDFDIIVDDEGCRSLAEAMVEAFDYDKIAQKLAERYGLGEIAAADAYEDDETMSGDELAVLVSEKLAANGLNEDAIADKTAAAVSNIIPEVDTDEIADKVVAALLPSLPAVREVDYDAIVNGVYEKLAEIQADNDYDIIIDDEGLQKLTDSISWKVAASTNAVMESVEDKMAKVKSDTEYIRGELAESAETVTATVVEEGAESVPAFAVADDGIKAELEEIKAKLEDNSMAGAIEDLKGKVEELTARIDSLFGADEDESYEEEVYEEDDGVKAELEEIKAKLEDGSVAGAIDDLKGKVEELTARIDSLFGSDEDESYEEEVYEEDDGVKAELEEIKAKLEDNSMAGAIDDLKGKVEELTARIDSLFGSDEDESYEEEVYEEDDGLGEIRNDIAVINGRLDEIKEILAGGAVIIDRVVEEQPAEEQEAITEEQEAIAEEQEAITEEQDVIAEEPAEEPEEEDFGEEELVTVSDIVDESAAAGEQSVDEAMETILEDVAEETVDGEAQPDGIPGISNGGVDFANMMKYNRSFIARIIQSSDDIKRYYGQVKNAMLAYKKVNSSIAWGAERFNKGRETIAKFKIRGKTLCLYLNLDPNEYKTSVYHQVDVSDNKSMRGTPMMVKIKSPLGARKAIRLIDEMLAKRNGEKRVIQERDYAAMYPYETIEELIEDGLVKDVSRNK